MYVKWVVRRHKNEYLANIAFYDAYLVQSYKNEANEPRQRTLAYLGNLRQIHGLFPVIERALFYVRMEDMLKRAELLLNEAERRKLYDGLATVASLPDDNEIRESESMNQQWHAKYWQARTLYPSDVSSGYAQTFEEASEIEPPDFSRITVIGRLSHKSRKS